MALACLGSLYGLGTAAAQVKTSVTEPYEQSRIAAVEQGVIQKIEIHEGQRIEAGQVLALMDQGVLKQARVLAEIRAKSQSRINSAKAELKLRSSQRGNMDSLINKGHANPFEVDQVLSQYEKAVAEYRGAVEQQQENKAELARIDAELGRRSVRSPIAGVVTEIHKRHGEYLSANDPVFATVVQLDRLRVRFYLDADETERLKKGQTVTLYVGKGQEPVSGTVEFVSPVVEPKTSLARVNVIIDNTQLKIRSGITCRWEKQKDNAPHHQASTRVHHPHHP